MDVERIPETPEESEASLADIACFASGRWPFAFTDGDGPGGERWMTLV